LARAINAPESTDQAVNAAPRTKEEAERHIAYSIRLHLLHERFYKRLRVSLTAVEFFGASAVIAEAIRSSQTAVTVCGYVVGIAAAIDLFFNLAENRAVHGLCRRKFVELYAAKSKYILEALDEKIALIEVDEEVDFESLRTIAFNDTLEQQGLPSKKDTETSFQRLMRFIVA
jgi:hypothetical protein